VWWQAGWVGEEDKCQGLGDLFREGIVKDERVIAALVVWHIVCSLGDLVRFAFAGPFDLFKTNARQLVDNSGLLVAAGIRDCCGEVLGRIGALGIGGRESRAQC
jgi:ABC-type nitrate/sulfonate/bicarbonate transport system permease component